MMQEKLAGLMEYIKIMFPELSLLISTFINSDGTVDGELRCGNLPENWRDITSDLSIISDLSMIFQSFRAFPENPVMGGKFWFTVAVRFGPQNEMEAGELAELYKRFRGMFQIGTYPTQASHLTQIQKAITLGLRAMLEGLADKRGLPPSVILLRFVWIPSNERPGHVKKEGGKDVWVK